MDTDLRRQDARARGIIARYREQGKRALAEGKPLPPVPIEITQLQREQTALLVQHCVALRAALGADATARLDAYLGYDFTPHIKLTRMSPPSQPVARQADAGSPAQSVTAEQQ